MKRGIASRAWRKLAGSFRHRRMAAFWLVALIAIPLPWLWLGLSGTDDTAVAGERSDRYLPKSGLAPDCDVLDVHDGDTLKLDCGWYEDAPRIVTVRLHCIDAPELGQEPWGRLARDHLKSLTGAVVAVEPVDRDRHGRTVARVYSFGVELNLQMVADGYAAVYPKYCREQRYYDAERAARTRSAAIWSTVGPQQRPWEWRQG